MENTIGNIYDESTALDYYKVVGQDVETNGKTDGDKLLEDLIPQNLAGKNVVDLGSGNGRHSELLAQRGASKVIAIDLSQDMNKQTKARKNEKSLDQIEIVQADMNHLPLARGKVDYIFSRFALMYASDLSKIIQTLSDSLTDNGEALLEVNVMTIDDIEKETEIKKEPVPLIVSTGDKQVNIKNFAHNLQEYLTAFEEANLKIVALEQFPAEELSVNPEYAHAKDIKLNYAIFKVVKIKDKE
jgi:ubiquinone/menaquinone biosynthesis C-methylase UbiE